MLLIRFSKGSTVENCLLSSQKHILFLDYRDTFCCLSPAPSRSICRASAPIHLRLSPENIYLSTPRPVSISIQYHIPSIDIKIMLESILKNINANIVFSKDSFTRKSRCGAKLCNFKLRTKLFGNIQTVQSWTLLSARISHI